MELLFQFLNNFVFALILQRWPGVATAIMNVAIGLCVATAAAVVAAAFFDTSAAVRWVAFASFLTYLAGAYAWIRWMSAHP